ncbi:hypothetical protein J8N05_04700 [Streptomyces sp. BH-SS-21]|uniref:Uncharacterized protein n=1 Tax=Streptomyces liliiviolaceus TaxID=2823109 RepID=A0A941B4V5_9ACTN|nr:hypothetical protein [Streptomyces liliiviolaceus]MBQ0847526.1 hypothetical protein [Streptomyces liliiviolaceus]
MSRIVRCVLGLMGAMGRPAALGESAGPRPSRVGTGSVLPTTASPEEHHVLEYFFEVLLILVCVGVLAFTGLAVKKLYQGQR